MPDAWRLTDGEEAHDKSEPDRDDASGIDALLREVARIPEVRGPGLEPERIGTLVAHFRVHSKLGQGGMGIVYGAEDQKLRRQVALKVLPAALVANEGRRRRFVREARSASAVLHPNLATVFEIGESEGTVFIAMEYVEGSTLRSLVAARGGTLPPEEALRIAREIARGVGRAHARGIVHRDLKPENVMIASDGAVKVLDFGLAKLSDGADVPLDADARIDDGNDLASRGSRVVGTPGYMSPEQAAGAAVDARSDVFSLGVMLYEMLSGVRPFGGGTTREVSASLTMGGDPPNPPPQAPVPAAPGTFARFTLRPVREVAPHVPPSLARVLHQCLEKDPKDRHADCGALFSQLEAIDLRRGASVGAWLRGHRVGIGIAALVATVTWRVTRSPAAPPPRVPVASQALREAPLASSREESVSTIAAEAAPSSPPAKSDPTTAATSADSSSALPRVAPVTSASTKPAQKAPVLGSRPPKRDPSANERAEFERATEDRH
jgi:serine/threonine-protein kinase